MSGLDDSGVEASSFVRRTVRRALADGDWRRFRSLRSTARTRFAEETLAQALALALDDDKTVIQRDVALEGLIKRRERERRALFEDFDRNHLPLILHVMLQQRLLRPEELADLSLELRRALALTD